jgi:hypothetical protein
VNQLAEPRVTYDHFEKQKDFKGQKNSPLVQLYRCAISGGASFVAMVQATHLSYRHGRPDF